MEKINGIYVPGLGDFQALGQDEAVAGWSKKYGIDFLYHPVNWASTEPFAKKLDKLTEIIDGLYKDSGKVALMGSSAGASAVLNAYAQNPEKVRCVVSICGKIQIPRRFVLKIL